ncbi:uncharacterized protein FOMMEDRAFT_30502 [Fomitiporia mediterranea MF3/22]|uniref:uncharacterized protein n=1 Tax=Fomitiporia mediterranea (strain MF3/22) TaxID=694068 RepID=UPI00044082B3|nr:uncharacterized protein FOMMEDRAFT_30502 [Fomitiporia mediterranea MF3/22]EJD00470.1 hypothetical protein FOMMEDRAFT_30502 [Fomitiporia mediterranea MF3/22]
MWLIEGAFDQAGIVNLEQKKLKLLKPGRSYPLGRKGKHPLQLVLSHPKISGEHVSFVVGESPVDSVNHRSKALQVSRTTGGSVSRYLLQPNSEDVVQDGDCIALVTGIYISIFWRPVCCILPPKSPQVAFQRCASLSVKVVSTPRPEITHHLTPTLSMTTLLAISLLTRAHVVRPEWLNELLYLGGTTSSADGPSVLESDFRLPPVNQYVPKYDSTLPASLKNPSMWEPNERRTGMLKGWRLLFVGEKGREVDAETRALVERGGGEYEVFDVSGGLTRWRQALSRTKRKAASEGGRGLSVLGDLDILQISAGDSWSSMLEDLKKAELCFVSRSQLLEAIFFIDTKRIDSSLIVATEVDSPLPDMVPNTHEEISLTSVASQSAAASGSTTHHGTNKLGSPSRSTDFDAHAGDQDASAGAGHPVPPVSEQEPASRASEEPEGIPGRRKPLVRRARTNATQNAILGVDDPSYASFSDSQTPAPEARQDAATAIATESQAFEKPPSSGTQAGRPGRLKKRVRTDKDYNPILASLEEELAAVSAPPAEQPPLKRFKALFDETDPDRVPSQMTNGASGGILDSQLFSQSETGTGNEVRNEVGVPVPPLTVIHEEGEAASMQAEGAQENGDVEMGDLDTAPPSSQPRHKPTSKSQLPASQVRAGPFDSTQVAGREKSKGGAAPGKHDTDAAFLQALASTKKGKRREDDFDREFNNLRISKPEVGQDAEAEDWHVLADFGDESNIRGNFMIIVEMDVEGRRKESSAETSRAQSRGPDFKKFKKATHLRPSVELVADDKNDYGVGPAYWKGSQSQPQSQGVTQGDTTSITQQGFLQPSQAQNRGFLQAKPGPSTQTMKPRSQSQARTQTRAIKAETQEGARRSRNRPLQVLNEGDEDNEDVQPRATRRAGTTTGRKTRSGKSQPLFLSDEEDEDAVDVENADHAEDRGDVELDLDLDDSEMSDEEPPGTATLRSAAASTTGATKSKAAKSPTKPGSKSKKRGAALLDDDSDTGVAFKGFGGRKKTKAK